MSRLGGEAPVRSLLLCDYGWRHGLDTLSERTVFCRFLLTD